MTTKRILVIGGGAAGMLAALFAAREGASVTILERNEKLGKKVYITANIIPHNEDLKEFPDFVKEVDALGGIMGEIADKATLQTRMLNLGNGPAVHSLRAQVDKNLYHRLMKEKMERTKGLAILECEVTEIIVENGTVTVEINGGKRDFVRKEISKITLEDFD